MHNKAYVMPGSKLALAVHGKDWDTTAAILRRYMHGADTTADTGFKINVGPKTVAENFAKAARFQVSDLDGLVNRPRGVVERVAKWARDRKAPAEFWNLFGLAMCLVLAVIFAGCVMGLVLSFRGAAPVEPEPVPVEPKAEQCLAKLEAMEQRLKKAEDWVTTSSLAHDDAEKLRNDKAAAVLWKFEDDGRAVMATVGGQVAKVEADLKTFNKDLNDASSKAVSALAMATKASELTDSLTKLSEKTKELENNLSQAKVYEGVVMDSYRACAWFVFIAAVASICLGYIGCKVGASVGANERFTLLTTTNEVLLKRFGTLEDRVSAVEALGKRVRSRKAVSSDENEEAEAAVSGPA